MREGVKVLKSLSLTTSDLGFPLSLRNVLGLIILIFIEKQRLNTFSPPPPPAPVTVLLLQCCCLYNYCFVLCCQFCFGGYNILICFGKILGIFRHRRTKLDYYFSINKLFIDETVIQPNTSSFPLHFLEVCSNVAADAQMPYSTM